MILTREEMKAVADRHYKLWASPANRYDEDAIRKELMIRWGMNSLQAEREIKSMKWEGII